MKISPLATISFIIALFRSIRIIVIVYNPLFGEIVLSKNKLQSARWHNQNPRFTHKKTAVAFYSDSRFFVRTTQSHVA